MGLQSTASSGTPKPMAGVAKRSSSTSSDAPGVYQVPDGKYFVGSIYSGNQQYGFRVHQADGSYAQFFYEGHENESQANFALQNITLYAGMYVTNVNSSHQTNVAGVEYEL
tara:strand:- start:106 stop:438 length:333 start_codon:yes stop_codon:yes gene_type:complete